MMNKSENITGLIKGFSKLQGNIKQPFKDASNPFFNSKYVPLENVVQSIMEASEGTGISFMQNATVDETGFICVSTFVFHESGEWIEHDPLRLKPVKADPQSAGSAITYAKRYALSAIFGITSDNDDDGNKASEGVPAKNNQQAKQPTKKATEDLDKQKERLEKGIKASVELGADDGLVTMWRTMELNEAINDIVKFVNENREVKND